MTGMSVGGRRFGVSNGLGGVDLSSAARGASFRTRINRCCHTRGTTLSGESHGATCFTHPPRAVDKTDWLKASAIILVSVDHFGYFFMEDDLWWSAFGRLAAPIFFFLLGFAQARAIPLRWIWLGVVLTVLQSWNAEWSWVVPNILLSLALFRLARPPATPCAARRVGRLLPPRMRALGGAADNVENSRLWLGGMAVGPVRPMPTHVCRRQNSCRCARRRRAREDREPGADAPAGLRRRCGRLRLAGTKGILVSSISVRRFHCRHPRFIRQPLSIPAWTEPHPTARSHRRLFAFHRPAHTGNLCHPACRLRTPYQVGARSRSLIEFR